MLGDTYPEGGLGLRLTSVRQNCLISQTLQVPAAYLRDTDSNSALHPFESESVSRADAVCRRRIRPQSVAVYYARTETTEVSLVASSWAQELIGRTTYRVRFLVQDMGLDQRRANTSCGAPPRSPALS